MVAASGGAAPPVAPPVPVETEPLAPEAAGARAPAPPLDGGAPPDAGADASWLVAEPLAVQSPATQEEGCAPKLQSAALVHLAPQSGPAPQLDGASMMHSASADRLAQSALLSHVFVHDPQRHTRPLAQSAVVAHDSSQWVLLSSEPPPVHADATVRHAAMRASQRTMRVTSSLLRRARR
jgi:hypothetical protein